MWIDFQVSSKPPHRYSWQEPRTLQTETLTEMNPGKSRLICLVFYSSSSWLEQLHGQQTRGVVVTTPEGRGIDRRSCLEVVFRRYQCGSAATDTQMGG